jgi:hypothetical protein
LFFPGIFWILPILSFLDYILHLISWSNSRQLRWKWWGSFKPSTKNSHIPIVLNSWSASDRASQYLIGNDGLLQIIISRFQRGNSK